MNNIIKPEELPIIQSYITTNYPDIKGRNLKNLFTKIFWFVEKQIILFGDGDDKPSDMDRVTYWLHYYTPYN